MKRFYQADSGRWYSGFKQRVGADFNNDGVEDAVTIAAIAGEPVRVVDVADNDPDPRDGKRFSDPVVVLPPKEKTPDEILSEELEVATTLTALKTALIKRFGG